MRLEMNNNDAGSQVKAVQFLSFVKKIENEYSGVQN